MDASMVAVIPENNFKKIISWIGEKGSEALYDIDNFNCADFAVLVFNIGRGGQPVKIQKEPILNGYMMLTTPNAVLKSIDTAKCENCFIN